MTRLRAAHGAPGQRGPGGEKDTKARGQRARSGNRMTSHRPKGRRKPARAGFSMLELMVAIAALSVGLLGFTQALVTAMRAQRMSHEQGLALEAARRQVELMKTVGFSNIFRQFNGHRGDDLLGPALAPGAQFAVPGLQAPRGSGSALPGEILFPVLEDQPGVLREDLARPEFGTPLDLDLDNGVIDSMDHASNYRVLPVVIRVRWSSMAGTGEVRLATMLGVGS